MHFRSPVSGLMFQCFLLLTFFIIYAETQDKENFFYWFGTSDPSDYRPIRAYSPSQSESFCLKQLTYAPPVLNESFIIGPSVRTFLDKGKEAAKCLQDEKYYPFVYLARNSYRYCQLTQRANNDMVYYKEGVAVHEKEGNSSTLFQHFGFGCEDMNQLFHVVHEKLPSCTVYFNQSLGEALRIKGCFAPITTAAIETTTQMVTTEEVKLTTTEIMEEVTTTEEKLAATEAVTTTKKEEAEVTTAENLEITTKKLTTTEATTTTKKVEAKATTAENVEITTKHVKTTAGRVTPQAVVENNDEKEDVGDNAPMLTIVNTVMILLTFYLIQ